MCVYMCVYCFAASLGATSIVMSERCTAVKSHKVSEAERRLLDPLASVSLQVSEADNGCGPRCSCSVAHCVNR